MKEDTRHPLISRFLENKTKYIRIEMNEARLKPWASNDTFDPSRGSL